MEAKQAAWPRSLREERRERSRVVERIEKLQSGMALHNQTLQLQRGLLPNEPAPGEGRRIIDSVHIETTLSSSQYSRMSRVREHYIRNGDRIFRRYCQPGDVEKTMQLRPRGLSLLRARGVQSDRIANNKQFVIWDATCKHMLFQCLE